MKMWDLEISDFQDDLRGHTERVTCVAIAGDSSFAVSGSVDKTVKVWSLTMTCVITDYKVCVLYSSMPLCVFASETGM